MGEGNEKEKRTTVLRLVMLPQKPFFNGNRTSLSYSPFKTKIKQNRLSALSFLVCKGVDQSDAFPWN
jgi:hypothetical protein